MVIIDNGIIYIIASLFNGVHVFLYKKMSLKNPKTLRKG